MKRIDETMEQTEKQWTIVTLASIPLIMTLGNSMLIPVLPMMEKELHISKFQSSLIITVYSVVAIFLIPIAGFLSDRYGRKKIIIPALIITGLGGLLAALASWQLSKPFILILLGRVLQGIGAAGAMPIVFPLIGDLFPRDEEASETLGIIETSNTVGKVLSPILGAFLASFIWFIPFFSIPLFCLISLLMIIFLVKEKELTDPITFTTYKEIVRKAFNEHSRWLIAVFLIGAILMFVLFGFLFYLSTLLEEQFHYKGIMKGFILAIPLMALSGTAYITGRKIKDQMKTMKWVTFLGIVFMGGSVLFLSFVEKPFILLFLFLITGIGIGMALPSLDALLTNSFSSDVRGIITSIYSSMRFIGVALGPPIVALLMKKDLFWIISLFAILALIGGVLAFRNIKP